MNAHERSDLDVMKEDLQTLKGDMKEIKSALLGDEYRRIGIIPEVKIMRKEVDDLNDFKKKIIWLVTIISVASGLAFQLIKGLIK